MIQDDYQWFENVDAKAAAERQIRDLDRGEGWKGMMVPHLERRIAFYRDRLLSGRSKDTYAADVQTLSELEAVLGHPGQIRAVIAGLDGDVMM